jgi:phospholipid/cholesterol/gamma-HCH transport system substrate-binding protein
MKSTQFKVRLGLFVAGGFLLLALAIFMIGRQKNLFNPVFTIHADFYNVSGLQVGNTIRFSGINVGTVDNIKIVNDSTVKVDMIVEKSIQRFIKKDSEVAIGSEGIIGDRVLIITQGSSNAPSIKEREYLNSIEPVEMDAIMASLEVTALNAEVISQQLVEIMININDGKGLIGMLIQDTTIAQNIDQTIINLKESSKGLDENMEAVKGSWLLRGYYKRQARKAEKAKQEELDKSKSD